MIQLDNRCPDIYTMRVDIKIFKEKMYKPHNAKIDVYYMNIVALLFMGAFAAFILWGHVGTGAKYFLLTNFGTTSTGTVAKIEYSINLSLRTRVHLTLREYSSSAYILNMTVIPVNIMKTAYCCWMNSLKTNSQKMTSQNSLEIIYMK